MKIRRVCFYGTFPIFDPDFCGHLSVDMDIWYRTWAEMKLLSYMTQTNFYLPQNTFLCLKCESEKILFF